MTGSIEPIVDSLRLELQRHRNPSSIKSISYRHIPSLSISHYILSKMRFVFVLSIPICSMALTLSEIRGPFPHARRLQDRNETWSEEMKLQFQRGNNTLDKYTSGFLRMDLFDWVRDVWIQAQVLPIGVCFNEGYAGGSAMLSEVIITDDTAFRSTNSYQSSDCTGEFIAYPYAQPVMDANRQLEQRISYVATYEEAVQLIPLNSDGLIVS